MRNVEGQRNEVDSRHDFNNSYAVSHHSVRTEPKSQPY